MAGPNPFDDILDAPFDLPKSKPPRKARRYRALPLIILAFGSLITALSLGGWYFIQLLAVIALFFLPRRFQQTICAVGYLLTTVQLLRLFPFYFGFNLGFTVVDFFSLAGFVLTIYVGHEEIKEVVQAWQPDTTQEENSRYNFFKGRFASLTDEEIENRLKRSGLTQEAKQALQDIMEERKAAK